MDRLPRAILKPDEENRGPSCFSSGKQETTGLAPIFPLVTRSWTSFAIALIAAQTVRAKPSNGSDMKALHFTPCCFE